MYIFPHSAITSINFVSGNFRYRNHCEIS